MSQTTTLKCTSPSFSERKTWGLAALFVVGNLALPQLAHQLPHGGQIWLPIYLLTLVAGYRYGWRVGLLTALLSPLANTLLFGMPTPTMLPVVGVKSLLVALLAAGVAHRFQRVNLVLLAGIIVGYQLLGMLFEWLYTGSFDVAWQAVKMGWPGMVVQLLGGWLLLRYLMRK